VIISQVKRWFYNIDSVSLSLLIIMMMIGAVLIMSAAPAVSERISVAHSHFLYKHFLFLSISIPLLLLFSSIPNSYIRYIAILGFILLFILMCLLPFIGEETKGARRWIAVAGFSLQPSEIFKAFYAVIIAMILESEAIWSHKYMKFLLCCVLHSMVILLLIIQPDFGMTILISAVTLSQMFVAGLPWLFIAILLCIMCFLGVGAYLTLPHVTKRIENFLSSGSGGDTHGYQVKQSVKSYIDGGIFGIGPGEGKVKYLLPDSHTDFIFAVAAEEMGALFCIVVVLIITAIIIRGFFNILRLKDEFARYVALAAIMYFAFQSIFNIGVTLHLFPTKGVTLPFISYGGSSMLSFAILMGLYINVTRSNKTLHIVQNIHIQDNVIQRVI